MYRNMFLPRPIKSNAGQYIGRRTKTLQLHFYFYIYLHISTIRRFLDFVLMEIDSSVTKYPRKNNISAF